MEKVTMFRSLGGAEYETPVEAYNADLDFLKLELHNRISDYIGNDAACVHDVIVIITENREELENLLCDFRGAFDKALKEYQKYG